jgi:thiamine-phosphate pyrophosphorylase
MGPLDRLREILSQAIRGGADMVQYRDKISQVREMTRNAAALLAISKKHAVPFIVNDRCDVCLAVGADGVHLGPDDIPVAAARKVLGAQRIIGFSCDAPGQVAAARRLKADYLGFGPVFASRTKKGGKTTGPRSFRKALSLSRQPLFAIGGISEKNLTTLLARSGVLRAAICRDICRAKDIAKKTARIKNMLARV